ncbi:MAG: type VI secretion system protein TssA, partial [Chthoniobacteraceae bacterium]
MKATVDSLLEPISADHPCGEDIGYDPQFIELDTFLQGKEETQFAAAEEPDWKAISERCLELFQRSKDLRVALRLTAALLKMEGLAGFRDGLLLLKGLLERYWDPVYPRLDPDDGNDPLERVNILSSLATAAGTFGDPFKILARLRQAPLSDSPQLGRISLADVDRSVSGVATEGAPAITASQVQGAFRSTPPEKLRAIYDAIVGVQITVKEIDDILTKAVGSSRAVAFDALIALLKEQQKTIAPYAAPNESVETGGDAVEAAVEGQGESAGISGSVRSRQDVIRVLEQICDFYRRTEPSSPVPLILQRARRLVDMDFMQLLTDLAPDSVSQINVVAGIRPEQ